MEIGEWVLNRVCADYREWQRSVPEPGRIAINLSLRQLKQASFIARCRSVFRKHGVSPTCFELELTETTLMTDPKRTIGLLNELYALGLHLAIDDFGTGYSSLSALQQFPIGTLKIDQSFVRDVAVDANDAALVRTIIDMGKSLDLEVIAEGVESSEQLEFLRRHGCFYAQGRLFGDAMEAKKLLAILASQADGKRPPRGAVRSAGAAAGRLIIIESQPPGLECLAMLSARDLTLRRGSEPLFEQVNFTIFRGNKVGLTGANGAGKSSLFAAIRGRAAAGSRRHRRSERPENRARGAGSRGKRPRGDRVRAGRGHRAAARDGGDRTRPSGATRRWNLRSFTQLCRPSTAIGPGRGRRPSCTAWDSSPGSMSARSREFSGGWRVRLGDGARTQFQSRPSAVG